jgi:CheY-like chemotaxis protein
VKVVVVEDNPVDMRLLRAVVESAGHEVITCNSAADALEEIILARPDVVLVDLNLPGIGGLELVRALRAHEHASAVPVLVMTAYPHCYTSRAAFDAGCSEWMVKPVDTRSLVPRLLTLCAAQSSP